MMMQDENVTFYRGYGEHKTREMAGWRDPNSFRSPMPSRVALLTLVLGALAAYYLYKHLKRG